MSKIKTATEDSFPGKIEFMDEISEEDQRWVGYYEKLLVVDVW